jgi:hypothetical protein
VAAASCPVIAPFKSRAAQAVGADIETMGREDIGT